MGAERVARLWLPAGGPGRAIERTPIMGLFKRSKTVRASRKPSLRERRAAERTARAEASLVETEQKIHQIADDARRDLRGSA
jgi:hypothetical protein